MFVSLFYRKCLLAIRKENYYFFDKKERKERSRTKFFIVVENEERKKLPPKNDTRTRTVGNERYNRFERERNERTLTMSAQF